MNRVLEKLRENTYIFQIITLMSGTLMAQVIMLAFIPILTRLYTPSEFGVYSLFFAISSMLGMVSSLKYEQAIMLPKSNRDAQALVFLSIVITLVISTLIGIVLILFYDFFLNYFNGLVYLVWLLPFSILVIGLIQIFNTYATRKQFYKKMAGVKMMEAVTTVTTQGISRYSFMLDGLIVGKFISNLYSLYLLLSFHLKKQTLQLKFFTKRRVKANIKRHENFPKYQSFSTLLNSFSQNIPVLLFTSLFSPAIAGLYTLTYRVMQAPILLIANSTRSVFYQKASEMYANGEDITQLHIKTTVGLIKLFIIPMLIILLFGEELFVLLFGEEWAESGVTAQITIVWFLFSFITPPTSMMYNILNLQKVLLQLQVITLIVRALAIYIGFYFFDSYMVSVVLFTIASVVHNLIFMGYIYHQIKNKKIVGVKQ
ncbi:MAG: oligosaccharide flippase family protein [Epsilonproteobacteria bacterium]|nr:oligosaccharide flippase family protein [Campylobacterota bacterium]